MQNEKLFNKLANNLSTLALTPSAHATAEAYIDLLGLVERDAAIRASDSEREAVLQHSFKATVWGRVCRTYIQQRIIF